MVAEKSTTRKRAAGRETWLMITALASWIFIMFNMTNLNNDTSSAKLAQLSSPLAPLSMDVQQSQERQTQNDGMDVVFELAQSQSFGFFYDVTDEHWLLLQKIYSEHENHRYPDKPLSINPKAKRDEIDPGLLKHIGKSTHSGWSSDQAWYQNNYEPNFSCAFEKRIGIPMNGEGAKWVCDPHRIQKLALARKAKNPNHPGCVIYSVGSSGDFTFEMGIQKEVGEGVCEFHIFDMGDYGPPPELKRAYYHQWGLEKQNPNAVNPPKPGKGYYGLLDTVRMLGHEQLDMIDIFKIDCEGCEWTTYSDWLQGGIPPLHQILVEVHKAPRAHVLNLFDNLEQAGYLRFHKEPNIQWDPSCLEYAFIKVDKAFMKGKSTAGGALQISG